VIMKNSVFWDIKSQYILRTSQETLRIRNRAQPVNAMLRSEVFTEVTMKNSVFWDVTPYCKNQRSGRTYPLHHQGEKFQ
jgi:hypothetical protein